MNVADVIAMYDQGQKPDYVFFWGSDCYFSNWHPAEFEVDGVRYWCTEQYMMARKAALFGDNEILGEIMASRSQKEIKALGRKVKNFNEDVWLKNRLLVMFDGNYAKFTQNAYLKSYIVKQRGKILVEASPYDTIWGVGLSSKDNAIYNPHNWRGENLLGFTLMQVRDQIIKEIS